MIKKDNLVKYSNDLNKLNISNLREKELELFFAICLKLKDRGTNIVSIDITDFKKEISSTKIENSRFMEYIKTVQKKFLSMQYKLEELKKIEMGVFFTRFKTDFEKNIMDIQINETYSYILNNLVEFYSQFDFKKYKNLKSKYSKILLPKLAQWDGVNGKKSLEIEKEKLIEILGVPQSYHKSISNFNKKVIKTLKEDLQKVFYNFKLEKIKKTSKGSKNEIKSYLFSWENFSKKEEIEIKKIEKLEISKKLKSIIDTAIKSPTLEILEKPSIIKYLLKNYNEDIIVLGLKQLINANLKNKIKNKSYIIKILEKIKQSENIRIVTSEVKEVEVKEVEKAEEIIEVTEQEFTQIKEKWMEERKKEAPTDLKMLEKIFKIGIEKKYKIIEKKMYTESDIDPKLLLGKNGKKLSGIVLKNRIKKILEDLNKN